MRPALFLMLLLPVLAVKLAVAAPLPRPVPKRGLVQRLRVNDTLTLVVSRPYVTFTTYGRPMPTWLWQRAELRGRRGYRQQLTEGSDDDLCTLYGTRAGADGTLLRLSFWRSPKLPPQHPTPQRIEEEAAFVCWVWDVRYRTWGWFYNANLMELGAQSDEDPYGFKNTAFGFTGGRYDNYYERGVYYLLPYWLAREQARARRTHCLPSPTRLAAYLELTEVPGLLQPAYRPLLARLLRVYSTCPSPSAAVAHRIAAARRVLALPLAPRQGSVK